MIRQMEKDEISQCVSVIREAFATVAEEFGFTAENAPRFTAFATNEERLWWHFEHEHRPMYEYCADGEIVGYYSLAVLEDGVIELNNLAVIPEYRHRGIGKQLLLHAFEEAKKRKCVIMKIGIVEENKILRHWYEENGFVHTGTEKFDFFPFTCGYLQREIELRKEK